MSESLTTFVCHTCTKPIGFPSQRRLTKHLKEVHGPRLKCDYCDYEYPASRKDNLRGHISIKHKSEEPSHTESHSMESHSMEQQLLTIESADTEPLDLSVQNKSKTSEEPPSGQILPLVSDTRKVVAKAGPSTTETSSRTKSSSHSPAKPKSLSSALPGKESTPHKSPTRTASSSHKTATSSKSNKSSGQSPHRQPPSRTSSSSHKTATSSKSNKSSGQSPHRQSPSRKSSSSHKVATASKSNKSPSGQSPHRQSPSRTSSSSHKTGSSSTSNKSLPEPSSLHRSSSPKSTPRRAITSSNPPKSPAKKSSGNRSPSQKSTPRRAITSSNPPKSPAKKSSAPHKTSAAEPSTPQPEKPKDTPAESKQEETRKRKSSETTEISDSKRSRISLTEGTKQPTSQKAARVRTLSESSTSSSSSSSSSTGSFSSADDPDIHFGTPPRVLSPVVEPFRPLPADEEVTPETDLFSIRRHGESAAPIAAATSSPASPTPDPSPASPTPDLNPSGGDDGHIQIPDQSVRASENRPSEAPNDPAIPSTSTHRSSPSEERPPRPRSPSIARLSTEFLRLVDITSNLAREQRLLSPTSLGEEYVPPGLQPGGPTYVPTSIPTTPYLPQHLEVDRRTQYDALAADPRLTFRGTPSADNPSLIAGYMRGMRRRAITNGRQRTTVNFPSNCCMMKTEEVVFPNGTTYRLNTSWITEPFETVDLPQTSSTK